jgi:hypothetical protein
MRSPYSSYPSAHGDVFSSMLQGNQAADDMEIARRQSELGKQAKQFSQQYALQGLQNDIAAQSQQNNLIQSRMDGVYGSAGNILRGLFND